MKVETSYDSGAKPFKHDKNRGKWETSKDFLYGCICQAFRPDIITLLPLLVLETIGVYALIPYLLVLVVCVLPIVFIQSFLGQFSSTGYISVFRIAPLFKGIGYVSLTLNFVNLSYFAVFTAIPLDFFVHSLRPTIPWSCEGASQWMNTNKSICNQTYKPSKYDTNIFPSVEFLRKHFGYTGSALNHETHFSIELIICNIIIWSVATFLLLRPIESIGRFIRYSWLTVFSAMSLCLLRFIFLPGAIDGLWKFFVPPENSTSYQVLFLIPLMAISTLGPGWGTIIAMSSYNDFKTNVLRHSWIICLATLGLLIGKAFLTIFLEHFMQNMGLSVGLNSHPLVELLALPMGLTFMEWPNLWSLLYASIFVLSSFNLLVIQLFSLFTSLFDEFECLREIKTNLILGVSFVVALSSMIYCSNHGFFLLELLSQLSAISQIILNFFLILVVVSVYGRERFQHDFNFMTNTVYSTLMANISRFIALFSIFMTTFLTISVITGFFLIIGSMIFRKDIPLLSFQETICIAILFFLLSWCLIPGYCVIKILKTAGQIKMRLKRCVRTTDWYPADPADKLRYEKSFSKVEITYPLTIVSEE